jgi:hypothetical protein
MLGLWIIWCLLAFMFALGGFPGILVWLLLTMIFLMIGKRKHE